MKIIDRDDERAVFSEPSHDRGEAGVHRTAIERSHLGLCAEERDVDCAPLRRRKGGEHRFVDGLKKICERRPGKTAFTMCGPYGQNSRFLFAFWQFDCVSPECRLTDSRFAFKDDSPWPSGFPEESIVDGANLHLATDGRVMHRGMRHDCPLCHRPSTRTIRLRASFA
jgi:hypothetical protein